MIKPRCASQERHLHRSIRRSQCIVPGSRVFRDRSGICTAASAIPSAGSSAAAVDASSDATGSKDISQAAQQHHTLHGVPVGSDGSKAKQGARAKSDGKHSTQASESESMSLTCVGIGLLLCTPTAAKPLLHFPTVMSQHAVMCSLREPLLHCKRYLLLNRFDHAAPPPDGNAGRRVRVVSG